MSDETRQADRRGWFADWDEDAITVGGWQPCLETGQGHIPCFQVWFATKVECEQWIADNAIKVGWFPGDPTVTEALDAAGLLATPAADTAHHIVADWTCVCGEDVFGGTAAYSKLLWEAHLRAGTTPADTGLKAAIEALADEWEGEADPTDPYHSLPFAFATGRLRAVLADHAPQAEEA